jgi:hypothetical protein
MTWHVYVYLLVWVTLAIVGVMTQSKLLKEHEKKDLNERLTS